jgi:predicted TIM-barrel fold metal-dependent hydrolase
MSRPTFYDAHFHALTLSHPAFLAFVQTLSRRGLEEVYAQISSPNYLIAALFFKGGERIRNMLAVMERDVASMLELMEDDLAGAYAKEGGEEPLISGGELRMGELRFGRLVLCPLVMDFESAAYLPSPGMYYDRPVVKAVETQVRDLLEGIRDYRRRRPEGFLELRPFIGVDPRHYSIQELERFLETSFAGYERGEVASRAAFAAMRDYDPYAPPPCVFAGVKVYPPLGFDARPEDGLEREKAELLWSFCERLELPVVTHCDDQGFRVVPLEEAWRLTSPERWEPVLRDHPRLRLDFAHFGMQYSHPLGRPASTDWVDRITRLMRDYEGVYADVSFDGTESGYYEWLLAYLGKLDPEAARRVGERLMFGSDFPVCMTKAPSYAGYYRGLEGSPLPGELRLRLCSENPERFLFG